MSEQPTIKFYTDTHIPKAVATQLRLRGVEVVRCEDVGMASADDAEHLEYATAHAYSVVTHDLDFWVHHGEWLAQGLRHTGIVLISNQFQSDIGRQVKELYELFLLIRQEAGSLEEDIYNQVYEIKEK
jgi:predicted nuclease of predicted toxin-antitoxin system